MTNNNMFSGLASGLLQGHQLNQQNAALDLQQQQVARQQEAMEAGQAQKKAILTMQLFDKDYVPDSMKVKMFNDSVHPYLSSINKDSNIDVEIPRLTEWSGNLWKEVGSKLKGLQDAITKKEVTPEQGLEIYRNMLYDPKVIKSFEKNRHLFEGFEKQIVGQMQQGAVDALGTAMQPKQQTSNPPEYVEGYGDTNALQQTTTTQPSEADILKALSNLNLPKDHPVVKIALQASAAKNNTSKLSDTQLYSIYKNDPDPVKRQLASDMLVFRRAQAPETYTTQLAKGQAEAATAGAIGYNKEMGKARAEIGTSAAIESEKGKGRMDADFRAYAPKARNAIQSLNSQWDNVEREIDKAITMVNPFTAGIGAWVSAIPATPQRNLAARLDMIKANIGFDKLQDMRQNSPTGGALGQVSDFENRLLQAIKGSLDQKQSAQQIKENLIAIKKDLIGLRNNKNKAFQMDYGQYLTNPSSAPSEQTGNNASNQFKIGGYGVRVK